MPLASPPKMFFLAGNYAKHVVERGGATGEREETFPYVFMKPASTTLTHPGDPILIPHLAESDRLGMRAGHRHRPPMPAR